ncbi:MAG: SNF2-related protein [Rikenellaceae bacterium]
MKKDNRAEKKAEKQAQQKQDRLLRVQKEKELGRKEILWYLSSVMSSVGRNFLMNKLRDYVSVVYECNAVLKDLENENKIISACQYYRISPMLCLDLLWELDAIKTEVLLSASQARPYYSYGYDELFEIHNGGRKLFSLLMDWRLTGKMAQYDWSNLRVNTVMKDVMSCIPSHPQWNAILKDLDETAFRLITQAYKESFMCSLSKVMIGIFKMDIVDDFQDDNVKKPIVDFIYSFFSHVLPGRILEIPNMKPVDIIDYHELLATYYLYTGSYTKAVNSYRKAILMYDSKAMLMQNPFYALLYVKALVLDTKITSKNRLVKVEKELGRIFRFESHLIAARIYMNVVNEIDNSELLKQVIESYNIYSDLELVLAVIIILHYKVGQLPKIVIDKAQDIIDSDEYLLLQLEASSSMPRYIEKRDLLRKRLSIEPIFEPHVVLESWQKNLNELSEVLAINKANPTEGKSNGEESARIIYLLNSIYDIQLRVQKSKNGITWTKGRNIALSTFLSGNVEGMTRLDEKISKLVTCNRGWKGVDYRLGGNEVLKALIDHPLVFSGRNQDVSVSIVAGTPHLRVKAVDGGYKVSSNVQLYLNYNTLVEKESDVLYKVYSLSTLQRKVIELFEEQSLYPLSAKEQLSSLIVHVGSIITVYSDVITVDSNVKTVEGSTRITAQFLPVSDGMKVEFFVKPLEDYRQYCKANKGEDNFIAQYNNESVVVKRDLKRELRNMKTVQKIVSELTNDAFNDDVVYFEDIYKSLPLIESLQELEKIARVEWPKGAQLLIKGSIDFKKMNISLRSAKGWFEVDGEVKVDKDLQLTLAELMEKNKNGYGRFIELSKGEFYALSEKLYRRLNELDANTLQGKKGLQLSQYSSGVINGLEKDGVKVNKDAAFKSLQTRIAAAEDIEVQVPPTLQAELRDYQLDGYLWMSRLASWGAGACLADDMGLGKTVQSIAVLLNRAEKGASLVVAPASVVHNWKRELQRFAPTLNCKILHDNISSRESIVKDAAPFDIVITTYGLLHRVEELITKKEWNVILLDEAHNIKNRDTKSSKVAMALKGNFRLMLTGTPIQNHLGEIWNLFNFTNPGLLGSFEQFTQKFINPIEQNRDKVRQRDLKRILQPFMLRRTKTEVLDELPTKTEIVYNIELSDAERALYENVRENALLSLESGELNPIQSLAEITKLRQLACHPALIDDTLPMGSSKVTRFIELATELIENRHRALVFSQFTSFLAYVQKALEEKGIPYLYLDGSTPIREREKLVQQFQQGEVPIFLISLKAGGTGLNLTAADYVIHLDPWWNPAIEDQASDRSHRIGQTRPVTIYKLISQGTIEEKIIELHKNKKSLADSLLEGADMAHKLTPSEILELVSGMG